MHCGNVVTVDTTLEVERRDHEREWTKRQRIYDELAHKSAAIEEDILSIVESDAPAAKDGRGNTHRRARGPLLASTSD